MKKLMAILLAALLLSALLPVSALAAGTEEAASAEESVDYAAVIAAHLDDYPEDTVVLTVNGRPVRWDSYYYRLAGGLTSFLSYAGELPEDWSADIGNGTTLDEYFRNAALQEVIFCAETFNHAEANGIELGGEELATLEEIRTRGEETYGGHDGYLAQLRRSSLTENAFDEYMRFNMLGSKLMQTLYIEPLTEEDARSWAAENEIVCAKHILLMNTDETGEAVDPETEAELRERMSGYREELLALEGDNEALTARFDELMTEHSEDPGSAAYPDGYVFGRGEMVAEFEEAAFALEDYHISDIVETSYGWHLLLRLPVTLDTTAGYDSSTYQPYTVRTEIGQSRVSADSAEWIADADVQWSREFEDFTVAELMSHKTALDKSGFLTNMTPAGWIITGLVAALAAALILVLLRRAADKKKAAEAEAADETGLLSGAADGAEGAENAEPAETEETGETSPAPESEASPLCACAETPAEAAELPPEETSAETAESAPETVPEDEADE